MTSYTVAFLSPEPVTMNWSSVETSQLRTEEDSLDCKGEGWGSDREVAQHPSHPHPSQLLQPE